MRRSNSGVIDRGVGEWPMSQLDRIAEYFGENRWEVLTDLAFAIAWVTIVSILFDLVDGPQWAYYLFMFAGVLAYYLLYGMSEAAIEGEQDG